MIFEEINYPNSLIKEISNVKSGPPLGVIDKIKANDIENDPEWYTEYNGGKPKEKDNKNVTSRNDVISPPVDSAKIGDGSSKSDKHHEGFNQPGISHANSVNDGKQNN